MNAAGIDVSSRKSMVAILRPFGEVVKLPFIRSIAIIANFFFKCKSQRKNVKSSMYHTKQHGQNKIMFRPCQYYSPF